MPAEHTGEFRIHVTKDYCVFSSAHFITFAGHRCEALHGHNYRMGVALEGTLDPESWFVFDFGTLKRIMKRACDEIDHRVLLPLSNPRLTIREEEGRVSVAMDGVPRYVFPRSDCALLPIPNTTVEMLAEFLAGQVKSEVGAAVARLQSIELEVEETFGQSAFYRQQLG
jgi:6-pyruvoyltetrahydropterin/6-carboxytetrahydropterin synthase